MTARTLHLRATAKINLVLELLGARPDGYTELATVFQSIDLADDVDLTLVPGDPGIVFEDVGAPPCPVEQNLAYRAARLFGERFGLGGRLEIRLTKRIPAGAGLGGGSSDAAAVLRGANALAATPVPESELAKAAAELGADVPYFLVGGTAIGRGRGDELEALDDLPEWPVVLAREGRPLATAEVFARAREGLTTKIDAPNIRRFLRHLRESPGHFPPLWNELQPAASRLEPGIPRLIAALEALGGRSSMTGSGSTVFALFGDERSARDAASALNGRDGTDFVLCTRTLPRNAGQWRTEGAVEPGG